MAHVLFFTLFLGFLSVPCLEEFGSLVPVETWDGDLRLDDLFGSGMVLRSLLEIASAVLPALV